MALIFSDGFSLYNSGTGAGLIKKWTITSTITMSFLQTGRWGSGSYSLYIDATGSTRAWATQNVTMAGSTTILGFAIRSTTTPVSGGRIVSLTNGVSTVTLTWAASNTISITDGGATTYFTTPSSLANNTWYYLELKVIWSASGGRIVYRMDSSQYYDSGATLSLGSSANTTSMVLGISSGGPWTIATMYTDLVLMDGTGSTFNDFQGDVRIETLFPDGDGSNTGWSLPGATLLTSVNQARFTTDTSGWAVLTGSPGFSRTATGGPKKSIPTYASLTGSSGTTSIISTPNGTSGYPVTPGQTLRVGGYSGINTGSSITVYLRFYDAAGATVGADVNVGLLSNAAGGAWRWNITSGTTVPATAATCAIILSPNSGGKFTGISLTTSSFTGYLDPSGQHHFETSETLSDDDTTYVSTNTVGAKDTYTMDDLQATTGSVLAVGTYVLARKDSASTHTISTVTRTGGVDHSGAAVNLPDNLTYQSLNTFYPINPTTGSAWTKSEVNNIEAGIEMPS